jgi:transcription antitermination factor NusG
VRFLGLAGYATYLPRLREQRARNGRRITVTPVLFPSYIFVRIECGQWWSARWCCGVAGLVTVAGEPARVSDHVVDGIRARERGGYVMLPEPPRLRPGDRVRVTGGLLMGAHGLFAGQRPHERVAVLLAVLGRVELPAGNVELA